MPKYIQKAVITEAYTFEDFVAYGKRHTTNIVNGMPWSFVFFGKPVTNENDDLYIVGSIQFKRGEVMFINEWGMYPIPEATFNACYTKLNADE